MSTGSVVWSTVKGDNIVTESVSSVESRVLSKRYKSSASSFRGHELCIYLSLAIQTYLTST